MKMSKIVTKGEEVGYFFFLHNIFVFYTSFMPKYFSYKFQATK